MGICPHCKQSALVGHFYARSWRIDLEIDESKLAEGKILPIPFWGEYPGNPGRGKHRLFLGLGCDQQAIRHARACFPEARIARLVKCDIAGEPLEGADACTIPVD